MSLLKTKLRHDEQEKEQIAQKVATDYIKPSETEQERAADVIRIISERFSDKLISNNIDDIQDELRAAIQEECEHLDVDYEEQKRIEKTVLLTALGNGPIEEYLEDDEVTEIVVQRYDNIVIERNGKIEPVAATFNDEEHLMTIIRRIVQRVGRQISVSTPIVDARLKDGSRVNATMKDVSPDGATLTIRKFNHTILNGKDYLRKNSMSKVMLYFLDRCVRGKVNILVSGGTGTGDYVKIRLS